MYRLCYYSKITEGLNSKEQGNRRKIEYLIKVEK